MDRSCFRFSAHAAAGSGARGYQASRGKRAVHRFDRESIMLGGIRRPSMMRYSLTALDSNKPISLRLAHFAQFKAGRLVASASSSTPSIWWSRRSDIQFPCRSSTCHSDRLIFQAKATGCLLNVDASTLINHPIDRRALATQSAAGADMSWSSKDKSNRRGRGIGKAVVIGIPGCPGWRRYDRGQSAPRH